MQEWFRLHKISQKLLPWHHQWLPSDTKIAPQTSDGDYHPFAALRLLGSCALGSAEPSLYGAQRASHDGSHGTTGEEWRILFVIPNLQIVSLVNESN